jgi:hypothetical protein
MLLALPPPWAAPTSRAARLGLLASTDLVEWRDLELIGSQSEVGEPFETPLLRRGPVADEPVERWPWLLALGVIDCRMARRAAARGLGSVTSTERSLNLQAKPSAWILGRISMRRLSGPVLRTRRS